MGAGCSNQSAVQTKDSVTKGQVAPSDVHSLSKEAQEQLKEIQQQNPEGTFGGTPSKNSNKLKLLMNPLGNPRDAGDDVADKDELDENFQRLKHKALWEAVELNEADNVSSYLDKYEEENGEELKENELFDETGNTIIHKAASLGHAESLMLLLERTGAKPDILNQSLATPLHLACKNNRVDSAKFLIGCGVDANCQDEHGQMPILICCIHGHYDLAKILIDASIAGHLPEPLDVDSKDHRGLSALNCAAIKGDYKMCILLVLNGGAAVDGTSPKGCTPLLYASRGGYADVVRFLLLKGASPLKQDNAGGTVIHHAIEKGHTSVLNTLLEHGFDVYSAIEIPDNAGRTPVFEAIDTSAENGIDNIKMLTRAREADGFDAKVNIMNYNGQTPLFSAVREGNFEIVKHLVEDCNAKVDLTMGELYKDEDEGEEIYDSMEEKFFMEAYKNSMTPLHVAVVLGLDEIMHYLIEHGANPNLQTKNKGYSSLHLAVLANKPEIIIELLTKSSANPHLPDFGGRTLKDMIEIFIPSYIDAFNKLVENVEQIRTQESENLMGLEQKEDGQPTVATHYYNPDDERTLKGLGGADKDQLNEIYAKAEEDKENNPNETNQEKRLSDLDESEIKIEGDHLLDKHIEQVYGVKISRAMVAQDWKIKEQAMKYIYKLADKFLDATGGAKVDEETYPKLIEVIKACTSAVSITCREKVIKVFSLSLQLLHLLISSTKIEKSGAMDTLKNGIVEKNIVLKLLQKSEEGNTRITNKIHETLLDLSYNPEVGEALTSSFILQRVQAHNRVIAQRAIQKKIMEKGDSTEDLNAHQEKIETEQALGNYKGLLAQLALLFKFINSFGIASQTRGPLSVKDILKSVLPNISHPNADVRNASTKILLDVHKLSGCVTQEELELGGVDTKTKDNLLKKLTTVEVEKNLAASASRVKKPQITENIQQIREECEEADGEITDRAEVPETISANSPMKGEQNRLVFSDLRLIIEEKAAKKDWQERELALKAMDETFQERPQSQAFDSRDLLSETFLELCLYLLKLCLEENNMTLYLLAIDVASNGFLKRTLHTDIVNSYLKSLITPIIMRTNDANTRVRKRSVELINQIWDYKPTQFTVQQNKLKLANPRDSIDGNPAEKRQESICQLIAEVVCDNAHGEKSIVGRLGLFIKRGQNIEGGKDLLNKPLQHVIGRTYEQLVEFSCQWISHKNTKIRQNALRLIIEVCRINCMDPRGSPFKQRIINYIMGLRPSQRDPLVKKINETCLKAIVANTSPGRANNLESYIDVSEMELNVATKTRAASMDHVGAKRRLQSAQRRTDGQKSGTALPQIGGSNAMPSIGNIAAQNQPTTVLPHSEPLTEEQIESIQSLIEMFGLPIMTCFLSKSWATRNAAVLKVDEQLINLDPDRRDAMSSEINKQNLPPELSFKIFLDFIQEGIKDPVLKNYIQILELLQQGLPIFFRFLRPDEIKLSIISIIQEVVRKTADMKQKIRESSCNLCLYLSHQSPIGPEFMIKQILAELTTATTVNLEVKKDDKSQIAASYGNSHMIVACLSLLDQYQKQARVLTSDKKGALLASFMAQINMCLKHSNPQVRKEAEKLFKTLYLEFGSDIEGMLHDQKPTLTQKLIQQAKLEVIAANKDSFMEKSTIPKQQTDEEQKKQIESNGIQKAQDHIRGQLFDSSQLTKFFQGSEEHLNALKQPNEKKKQKAIIELKKLISKKINGDQMSQDKARELSDPLTMLIRHLLIDSEGDELYLESLNLLKFVVGSLAPYLSTLDLHLMMGQFVGIIVSNTITKNMRVQVQTDKVVIFFAKHQNIGSLVVAREILKNIERFNCNLVDAAPEVLTEKAPALLRFYSILQLLLQQFSIILCYQQDFYGKVLEQVADSCNITTQTKFDQTHDQATALKHNCQQIVFSLYSLDAKLLDQSVSKLDLSRKTPLRKMIIEHESQEKKGRGYMNVAKQSMIAPPATNTEQMRETQMSFASSANRTSLFSPGSTVRGNSPGGFGSSFYNNNQGGDRIQWPSQYKIDSSKKGYSPSIDADNSAGVRPRIPMNRRMQSTDRSSAMGSIKHDNEDYYANHPVSSNLTQSSWRPTNNDSTLPSITSGGSLNKTGQLLPRIGGNYQFEAGKPPSPDKKRKQNPNFKATGGAGFSSEQNKGSSSYEPSSASRKTPRRTLANLLNKMEAPAEPNISNMGGIGQNHMNRLPNQSPGPMQSLTKEEPVNKPPLYMPTKREPSENRRSQDKNGYKPKTGFSTVGLNSENKSIGSGLQQNREPSGTRMKAALPGAASSSITGYVPSQFK